MFPATVRHQAVARIIIPYIADLTVDGLDGFNDRWQDRSDEGSHRGLLQG
jgi:hypothetical protein